MKIRSCNYNGCQQSIIKVEHRSMYIILSPFQLQQHCICNILPFHSRNCLKIFLFLQSPLK